MRPFDLASVLLLAGLLVAGCPSWEPGGGYDDDDSADDDDAADDDTGDDDSGDDDDTSTEDVDGDGFSEADGDCHDGNANIYPGAPELCDGIDDDCDGVTPPDEVDADGDGWMICVGDCDDAEPAANPGEVEIPGDGLDNDCDGVTDPAWIPISGTPDPQGDHGGYVVDLATLEYRQSGSAISFRVLSYETFDDADAMVDVYVDNGTDSFTLTWDQGDVQFWSSSNGWAAPLSPPPSLSVETAGIDSLIVHADLGSMGLGGAATMDTAVGVGLVGADYQDLYPDSGQLATVPLGPAPALVVDSTNFSEVSGDGDSEIEAGEQWDVDVLVRNDGDVPAAGVVATLEASAAISVPVPDGSYGVIQPGSSASSYPPYTIDVGLGAAGIEELVLRLEGANGTWLVPIEVPIDLGLPTPAYEQWDYAFDVFGNTVSGDIVVTILDASQVEVCDHRLAFDATYDYGTSQGGYWPDVADETLEFTAVIDTFTGSCPSGYHDLYSVDASELLTGSFTLLAFISCDVADGSFHGDDLVTGNGSGTQESWCDDVGPDLQNYLNSGAPEAIAVMLTGNGDLAGLGNYTYYPSADGLNYWAHMGMVMVAPGNGGDPAYGMLGAYMLWVNWIFGI